MSKLYLGIPFSPPAIITDNIGEADTIIKVSDVSAFPPAPNYATIGADEGGETIIYNAKTETALSGCVRGVEGTAKPWPKGELIARNFTAADQADIAKALDGKQNKTLTGQGEPTAATAGVIGQHYLDTDMNAEYLCLGHDETEGYIWVAPFLVGSGGKIGGTFEVMDYFKVGPERVFVTRRLMGQEANFASEVNVGGSLTVEKTGDVKGTLTVGQADGLTGYRRGNLVVFGSSQLQDDVTIGRVDADGSNKGHLTVLGQIFARATTLEGTLTTQNIYPDIGDQRSIGKNGGRFNTAYVKKVDAAEHVSTPKVRPPQGVEFIKFMCAGGVAPKKSPNPLPMEWGGTGKCEALTATDVGAANRQNMLINPRLSINQRGLTYYCGNEYTVDNWRLNLKTEGGVTVTGSGVELSARPGGVESWNILWQQLDDELLDFLHGKDVTISILYSNADCCRLGTMDAWGYIVDNGPSSGWILLDTNTDGKISCASLTIHGLNTDVKGFGVEQGINPDNHAVEIYAVKLELGDKQTLAHEDGGGNWVLNDPPNGLAELEKCRESYFKITESEGGFAGCYIYQNSGIYRAWLYVQTVPMKKKPTISAGGVFRFRGSAGEFDIEIEPIAGSSVNVANGVLFQAKIESGDSLPNRSVGFVSPWEEDTYIVFDAD